MDVSLNAHNYDQFLEQFPLGSFLQSRFWKRFLTLQGKKNWQLNVYDGERLVAHCLLYTNKLAFGKDYLYAPKGPILLPTLSADERKEALELILSQIRDITIATRRREEIFCRIEPNLPVPELMSMVIKPSRPIQPKTTLYLNLDHPYDELFAKCKEKTRYNIRLAEKKGVQVFWSQDELGLSHFLNLLEKSKQRNRIRSHNRRYYKLLLDADPNRSTVFINWASYENRPIAANLYLMQYPTITYLHGGFDYHFRHLMAPYLLQWEAIKKAKEHTMGFYDFWGYAPDDASNPTWAGFSRFKAGFGGTAVNSPGSFDFIYNPFLYNVYERLRDMRRLLP